MDCLRLITSGNVDDGKSTLIGRLLIDCDAIKEDQLAALRRASGATGADQAINLALVTDGLRAERELGITMDVAYRYFGTADRRFILADCPGHFEYTRNMVTAASRADLALLLVDARPSNGFMDQTRRHLFVMAMLRVPHVVVCINKMDLVGNSEARFEELKGEITRYLALFGAKARFIPISALSGANVTQKPRDMPWYSGPTVLEALLQAEVSAPEARGPARICIQRAVAPGIAQGALLSGGLSRGEEVYVMSGPLAGRSAKLRALDRAGRAVEEARAPHSVALKLDPPLSVGRGDLLARATELPQVSDTFDAMLFWMGPHPLCADSSWLLRQGAAEVECVVEQILWSHDVADPTRRIESGEVSHNGFARVRVRTERPLAFDDYADVRATGALVLIDPVSCETVAAGTIGEPRSTESE